MCSLAIMRSCIIVRHLLCEAGASTEKNDLPDRVAARIAPEARVQKKRVLVPSAPQTVRAGEANRVVGAVLTIATCEALAPSVKCVMKDAGGVNPLVSSMRCAAKAASAKCMWARAIVVSVLAKVRALTHRGWPIVPLRPLCLSPRLRLSCA